MKYTVRFYMDNTYEVLEFDDNAPSDRPQDWWKSVFQGSLSDCEAYIWLHEGGYM